MITKLYTIIFVLFLIAGCNNNGVTEVEGDIYRTLVNHMGGDDLEILVIRAMSVKENRVSTDLDEDDKTTSEAQQRYKAINKKPSKLPISYSWDGRLKLLTKDEENEIFMHSNQKMNWVAFYSKYPGASGIIGLSRVGFNKEISSAIVYIEISCGTLCGNGYKATLEKDLFGWYVKYLDHLWIS